MEINVQELRKIIALHRNIEEINEKLEREDNNVIPEEYYLININWVKQFKTIFHYDGIIKTLEANPEEMKNIEKTIRILNLPKVSKEERDKIKIIKNADIIGKNKGSNPYFFQHFCLIKPKYYEIITDNYIIDNKIKYNIIISNRTLIIDLPQNAIEIGIFDSFFSNDKLYLLQFLKKVDLNYEIKKIISNGFIGYLNQHDIKKDILEKYNEIHRDLFELSKLNLSQNNNNNGRLNKICIKGLDISNKKGFINYDPEGSKLNSIIQILTSIKDIYDFFIENEKTRCFSKFNHIYVFSSFFLEAIKEIYNQNNKKSVSLNKMIIINNFLSPDIGKKDLSEYLSFILQTLHNELISFPTNLNNESLISFNSPYEQKEFSLSKFTNYYNDENLYKKSIISELFNFVIEKKANCKANFSISSFQAFPLIIFNIELLFNNQNLNNDLIIDLTNCFENFSKLENKVNNEPCKYCNQKHSSNSFIYSTPSYFIIVLDRKNLPNKKIKYSSELDVSNFVENSKFKKYKLFGIIMEEQNRYYSVIRNEKDDSSVKNIENWKIFQGEKIFDIKIEYKKGMNKEIYDKIYNQINSRILFYKGID